MTKEEVLHRYFGYTSFREGQARIVDALLDGRDALCVMPTGAGKSVCYQVPALLLPGVTLVVSPLISLMKDQVESLCAAGVRAAYLNSSLTAGQYARALQNMENGVYKIIYVAPERLFTPGFQRACGGLQISLLAVDEAHCVSQWGQDFRPDYTRIASFASSLPTRPPVGAFTATATRAVREDIAAMLELRKAERIVTGFDRPNLYFGVERPSSKALALLRLLEARPGRSGIVYCSTRRAVEETAALLTDKGFSATRYHAGLTEPERRQNQEDFVFDRKSVMVATNAFGMGIDKSNVSFVIHYNMPKDLESYYQEAGRAGRDGEPADCVLLYSAQDVHTARYLIEHGDAPEGQDAETLAALREREYDRLRVMTFYCTTDDCLRGYILKYFGEHAEPSCGNCSSCAEGLLTADCTEEARQALLCIRHSGGRFGAATVCAVLRGSEAERIRKAGLQTNPSYGALCDMPEHELRRLLDALLARGFLVQTDGEYPVLRLLPAAAAVLDGEERLLLRRPQQRERASKAPVRGGALSSADTALFGALKQLRAALARKASVPAYVVFTDATLRDMAEKRPESPSAFLEVSGVGEAKAARYGAAFLKEIRVFLDAQDE